MLIKYECNEHKEGKTKFLVPERAKQEVKGPYRARGTGVFFNPQMEISRDITIAVVRTYFNHFHDSTKKLRLLDGLAGTGIRGLRIANESELENDFEMVLNDGNPDAAEMIKENIGLNHLEERTEVVCANLNTLLTSSKYSYIDIDPFGTPIEFLDNAVRAVRPGGILAVTATDTAPLCGTYPRTCRRRYGAEPLKNEYMHESGLRILAGYTARTAAKYDLYLEPIMMYYMDYYFRIFLRVGKGVKAADSMLYDIGYVIHDDSTDARHVTPEPLTTEVHRTIGPMWVGPLCDRQFVERLSGELDSFRSKTRLKRLCEHLLCEGDLPPWFYEINKVSSLLKIQPFKFSKIKKVLEGSGLSFSSTHFSPQGFKTDASIEDLRMLLS